MCCLVTWLEFGSSLCPRLLVGRGEVGREGREGSVGVREEGRERGREGGRRESGGGREGD